MAILKFNPCEVTASSVQTGASWWAIRKVRLREWAGRFLNRLGFAGAVQETEVEDQLTGQHVRVRVGDLFTVISVNGRDYYFHRLSGKYDGSGMGCR